MLLVALKLLGLLALAMPVAAAALAATARAFPRARASDLALAVGVFVPGMLVVETVLVGLLPVGLLSRPLDSLLWFHIAVVPGLTLLAWALRVPLRGGLITICRAVSRAWRAASGPQRLLIALALASHLCVVLAGTWVWTTFTDEQGYHVPQMVQMYQDGRLGRVWGGNVWADSYPRGTAILWAWSLCITGTDAGLRPINAAWALLLAAAVATAARRIGADRSWALTLAAAALTTPVIATLSTIAYADAAACAAAGVAIATALPRGGRATRWDACSMTLCIAGMVLALWIKFTTIHVVALVLAFRGVLAIKASGALGTWGRRPRGGRADIVRVVLAAAAVAVLASAPYLSTWFRYGSPVFPLRIALGPWVLFDGPMTVESLGWERGWGWWTRLYEFWYTFHAWLDPEGKGQLGPLWGFALLGALVALAAAQLSRPRSGLIFLTLVFALVLVVPNFHWARYCAWVLVPAGAAAAWLASKLTDRSARAGIAAWLLVLCVANGALFWQGLWARIAPTIADAGDVPLWSGERLTLAVWRTTSFVEGGPSIATRLVLERTIKPGQRLVSTLACPPFWLQAPGYAYAAEVRPARAWPAFDYHFAHARELDWARVEAPAWAAQLASEGVDWVLVYAGQAEDGALAASAGGYECVHVQPSAHGTPALHLYQRTGSRPAAGP
ncbi:MAG: hypothetical protein ACKVS8_13355 [Phycisphaerales bacterium]